MLKKDITYTNFDERTVTETFYFHLSQVELLRWEASLESTGGLSEYFQGIMNSGDGAKIMAFMEDLIERSYGKKSPDGNKHLKSAEILADFKESAAYDTFFMSLVTNPDNAAEFMNGIVPKELAQNVDKMTTRLDRVKAEVERRHPSDTAASQDERVPVPLAPVSDPAQGGNVFEQSANADERVPVPLAAVGEEKSAPIHLTNEEITAMDRDELVAGIRDGRFII